MIFLIAISDQLQLLGFKYKFFDPYDSIRINESLSEYNRDFQARAFDIHAEQRGKFHIAQCLL